tara:strand:- start:1282 stop:1602 length:321 start_codon:yes stop_codon:yes gene_type:complete
MTKKELNKLQGLINSGSPTNWELVRLILEANGETDGLIIKNMFKNMLIGHDWKLNKQDVHFAMGINIVTSSPLGRKTQKYYTKHYVEPIEAILFKETKYYDELTKD